MADATMDRRPDRKGDQGGAGMGGPGMGGAGGDGGQAGRPDLGALLRELVTGLLARLAETLAAKPAGGGGGQGADATGAAGAPAAAGGGDDERAGQAQPATHRDRRYRYAHGDVDLSRLPANVPTAEERQPRRGGGERRYYFLPKDDAAEAGGESRGDAGAAASQPRTKPG